MGKSIINPRGARIVGIGEVDAGRQHRGDDVTITVQPTVWADMDALGECLRDPRTAQAMLAHRCGAGVGARQPAASGAALVSEH